jgi:hypothetical protein
LTFTLLSLHGDIKFVPLAAEIGITGSAVFFAIRCVFPRPAG